MPDSLLAKLAAARRRMRGLQSLGGAAFTAAALFGLAIASFYHDRLVILTSTGRLVWLLILISVPAAVALARILLPLRKPIPDVVVATHVERKYPALGERLLSTIELAGATAGAGVSMQIIGALTSETVRASEPLDFAKAVSTEPLRRPATFAGIAGFIILAQTIIAPQPMTVWLNRILHPNADIPIYAHTRVSVTGEMVVPRGSNIDLNVWVARRHVESSTLHYKFERGSWNTLELRKSVASTHAGEAAQMYSLHLPDAQQDVTYYAAAGDGQTNPHTIRVEDRPTILSVKLDLAYPAYTGRKAETVTATSGNIVAPVGTHVTVTATANKPLATASLVENGKPEGAWQVHADKVDGSLKVTKDLTYGLALKDTHGFAAENPPQYTVRAQPDRTPEVQIVKPGGDVDRTPSGSVSLGITANDDYGVESLAIAHRIGKRAGSLPLPVQRSGRQVETAGVWNLSRLALKPGDTVEYEALATDGDNISGPHTGHSSTYRVHILSATEMRERIDAMQMQEREALKELVQRQKDAQAQLADAQKHAKPEKLQQAQASQRSIAQESADLAKRMQQTSEQMKDNSLGTQRELDRRNATQNSLQQLAQKQMPAAADSIQRAEQRPAERSNELNSAARQEQAIKDELDRLARGQERAPDISKLAEQADKLAQQQQRLADKSDVLAAKMENKSAAEMTPQERAEQNALAKEQAQVKQQTSALQQQVKDAAREAAERNRPQAGDLANAQKQLQQSGVQEKQSAAQQSLQQGKPSEASQPQNQAAKDLQNLAKNLDQAGQKQNSQDLESRAQKLDELADKLQDMANRQREVNNQVQRSPDSEQSKQLAQKEADLNKQAGSMMPQLKDAPAAQQSLNNAQQGLQKSQQQLSQGQSQQASSPSTQARNDLQRAAKEARDAARDMQEQQQARELQQQLEKMAKDQRTLEKQTQQLDKTRQNGQLPQPQQQRAQQLAAAQSQLMEKGRGMISDMPSSAFRWAMTEAGRRMENASKGLQQQNPGSDTQRNQENAAQLMERIARSLGQQADGKQQQSQAGGQQSGAEQDMAEAAGDLQLAREMEAQLRQETGSLDKRRAKNPNQKMTAEQEREAYQLQASQRENRQFTDAASRKLRSSPEISNSVRRAAEQMEDVEEMLRQQQTGDPTQGKQDQIVQTLDRAIQQSKQAMREQRQQRMAQQGQQPAQQPGQQPGEPNQPGGNNPKGPFTQQMKAQTGPGHPFDVHGRGFGALGARAQQSMREGQQERVPAEYRELVNQYYKALSERSK